MRILILLILCSIAAQANAQQQIEKEINQFIQAQNWDQVMIRSLDMITEEPLQAQGYYYTALALCRQTQFAKAEVYNKNAFLFGDEIWKTRSRNLSKQILELKVLIPQPVNLNDINSLDHTQWYKLWEYDKTNINAGINAVELMIKSDALLRATEILDDPSLAKIPGAKELRKKLSGNKDVAKTQNLGNFTKTGDAQMERKEFEAALISYKKALALAPNSSYLASDVERAEDEILWKKTINSYSPEAYQEYLNKSRARKYAKQARAKINDNLKIQIQAFIKRNEIDQAEAAYAKYLQNATLGNAEKQEFEKIFCESYFNAIYALSDSKERADKRARLTLYYKARKICELTEAQKKEIAKLEKSLN